MASYRSPSSGTKRRGQGRGRMSVPAARKKASTSRRRNPAPKKTRGQGRGYMDDPASVRKGRTMKKAGKAAAAAAKKRPAPRKPKKDTRTRGGQGSDKSGNDQAAFQRFVNMTPAQQRYVMKQYAGETRRKAR